MPKPWYRKPAYYGPIAVIVAAIISIISHPILFPHPPDFSISVNPMLGSVQQGGVIQTTIKVKSIHGYKHTVSLSASGQPPGAVIAFIPPSGEVKGEYASTMTINVGSNVPTGDYTITAKGMGADGKEHICSYILTIKPTAANPTQTPTSINLNPAAFRIQEDNFFYDTRSNVINELHINNGVDLTNYYLEFTFQGGNGRRLQLWYKDSKWMNVYSFPYTIQSAQSIRFNPFTDGRDVNEFNNFTNIYAIGAKVIGGVKGIQIASARLIRRH